MSDEAKPELQLRYGRIILAEFIDRNGFRKLRPGIVITPTGQIRETAPLLVMAITTTFGDPAPQWHVPLPWNSDPRRVGTGLARRSAAVVAWMETIAVQDVRGIKGQVPAKQLRLIENELAAWVARHGSEREES